MHEMHLVNDLYTDLLEVAEKKDIKEIKKIYIKIGEFTELNEDIIRYFFKEKGKGTVLENSKVVFEKTDKRELRLLSFDYD